MLHLKKRTFLARSPTYPKRVRKWMGLNVRAYKFSFQKIWYQRIWPFLTAEMQTPDSLSSVLQPVMYLIEHSTLEEYEKIILPEFRLVSWLNTFLFPLPKTSSSYRDNALIISSSDLRAIYIYFFCWQNL